MNSQENSSKPLIWMGL